MMYGKEQTFNNENKIIDKMMEMDPIGNHAAGREIGG